MERESSGSMGSVYQLGKDPVNVGVVIFPGQYQNTPFNNAEQAVAEFEKIFKQKTGNQWSDRENFEKKSFKYRLVEHEVRKQVKWKDIKLDLDFSLTASNLDEEVKKVIEDISSASTYMAFRDVGGTNEGK